MAVIVKGSGGGNRVDLGFPKISSGEFTLSKRTLAKDITIEHGLGIVPKMIIIYSRTKPVASENDIACLIASMEYTLSSSGVNGCFAFSSFSSLPDFRTKLNQFTLTDLTFSYVPSDSYYFSPGIAYHWIVLG